MADYYNILGVNKEASDDEIKKAYRKLSMKYHPDKLAGKSEAERKEGEEKFKEINDAYQILSDQEKRRNYDQFGDPDGNPGFGGFNGFGGFGDMFGGFRDFFSGRHSQPRGPMHEPGKSLKHSINITIKELLDGCKKTFNYQRGVRCHVCHGVGGEGKITCPKCGGTGRYRQVSQTPFGTSIIESVCPECGGKGSKVSKVCSNCHGEGIEYVEESITIDIQPMIQDGQSIKIDGKGFESKDKEGPNGDLYIIINYNLGENFRVQGNDIFQKVNIPWYDALLGCDYEINIGNGTKTKVFIPECTPENKIIPVRNINLHGFNYYIVVNYNMPDRLTTVEREALKTIKKSK